MWLMQFAKIVLFSLLNSVFLNNDVFFVCNSVTALQPWEELPQGL